MYEYEPVLLWIRVLGVWHVETEDGVTFCYRPTPATAERTAAEPAEARCPECVAVRRRLRELQTGG